jgi:thiol-disulfide isomerase/thioredoxin
MPDWRFSHIIASPTVEVEFPRNALESLRAKMVPKEFDEETDMEKQSELYKAWNETEDGKQFKAAYDDLTKDYREAQARKNAKGELRRVCAVNKDGTFRLDDMPDGYWQLTVQLDAPPTSETCGPDEQIGKLEYKFSVPVVPGGVSDEPLDIGTLEVKKLAEQIPFPRVGDVAPEFEIVKVVPLAADAKYEDKGEKLRLSDFKGKYVILDFWSTWCGPCLEKVPELKTLYATIKDDDRFVMIGISLDNVGSEEALGKFVARREMPWLHGLCGDWQSNTARTYGVQAIPALLLIGTDGKVLLSNPDMAELAKTIDDLRGK